MSTDNDYQLALLLQSEYDLETSINADDDDVYFLDPEASPSSAVPKVAYPPLPGSPGSPKSVVDKEWELIDPNPDIRALFIQFNDMFFWGKLNGIEVKWSPRMTLCAGLCVYEGRGGLCSVRLSLPLLKLRPRKDLVETLLHEMIHAYLFVTDNNKDHDGHGPEFQKHMNRINSKTGSNISIYHTFHDEVDSYRQHWWRCDGPCQRRPPYYGFVKRAMNRAPSARDPWWGQHQASCGGAYTKVREPENYGKKKSKKKEKEIEEKKKDLAKLSDIRAFMGPGKLLGGGTKKDSDSERGEKRKPSSAKGSADSGKDSVIKSEKKNSVSSSSEGHSSSKHKSDHKSHKDDKPRHGSHSSSKDHEHSSKHKSSSKSSDSSDKKSSSSSSKSSHSDSKKPSSSASKSSTATASSSGSKTVVVRGDKSKKKSESTGNSSEEKKKSNIHGYDGGKKEESELGEPGAVAKGSNVHGFGGDKSSKEKSSSSSSTVAFSGKGHTLGSGSGSGKASSKDKHRHKHKSDERSSEKSSKSHGGKHSKKRPSEEGSSGVLSKKAKKGEENMFGAGRSSKFRSDSSVSHIALNDPDDMVPCPVCATRIRATDINGHLDTCLGGL